MRTILILALGMLISVQAKFDPQAEYEPCQSDKKCAAEYKCIHFDGADRCVSIIYLYIEDYRCVR